MEKTEFSKASVSCLLFQRAPQLMRTSVQSNQRTLKTIYESNSTYEIQIKLFHHFALLFGQLPSTKISQGPEQNSILQATNQNIPALTYA